MLWVLAASGCTGSKPVDILVADGELTWTVTYDADAAADGAVDCTYTRRYEATEDQSTPWLCPDCDHQLLAEVALEPADQDCYRSLTGSDPPAEERIGWTEATLFRAAFALAPLGELAVRVDEGGDELLRVEGGPVQVERGAGAGTAELLIDGELTVSTELGDPWSGMTPPRRYACRWPSTDRRDPYDGPWQVTPGEIVPDGWFRDACGEPVRLHDLEGYLVIEASARDCGPCQVMASEEGAFAADMALDKIDVQVVTLLVPALDDIFTEASGEQLEEWASTFALHGPVLADRGWGYAMTAPLWSEHAYPSWFVVAPNLDVIAVGQGYGGWGPIRDVIVEHAE